MKTARVRASGTPGLKISSASFIGYQGKKMGLGLRRRDRVDVVKVKLVDAEVPAVTGTDLANTAFRLIPIPEAHSQGIQFWQKRKKKKQTQENQPCNRFGGDTNAAYSSFVTRLIQLCSRGTCEGVLDDPILPRNLQSSRHAAPPGSRAPQHFSTPVTNTHTPAAAAGPEPAPRHPCMPKVIIFAGAPEADWSSPDSLLLSGPPALPVSTPTSTSTSLSPSTPATQNGADTTTIALPSWRSLPLYHKPLTTGYSQPHGLPSNFLPPAHFFSLSWDAHQETANNDTTTTTDSQDPLSQQFCNHSLALHHDLASSQLPPPPSSSQPPAQQNPSRHRDNNSFNTTATDSFISETTDSFQDTTADLSTSTPRPPLLTSTHHLSDLEDIPPAPSLLRLAPQTVTVNLIAGVISVSTPRSVTTRWGSELSLVEVLLGDDTRAGFGVTFWLPAMPPPPPAAAKSAGKPATADPTSPANLRGQDVVLLQNCTGRTEVGGGGLSLQEEGMGMGNRARYTRSLFVGGGGGGEEKTTARGVVKRGWDALPDDTQEREELLY
ncbi:hypothetical protein CCUS01_11426 [Colletotrichum cuscutae]|uniref:Uncharacterized protein n=1 Tax=Colletotrichum cuscutae TaxID=1209917 RepID=A0AAI9U3A4_9PEZI|nr:hypothetical protein CCUS01_11426 [Colletotrichum cuscutae]